MTAIAITENTANLESDLPKVKVAIFMMALSNKLPFMFRKPADFFIGLS